jgi:hypothetical protein
MAQIILTGSGTWNLPSDWNDASNTIEVYGSGASGAAVGAGSGGGGGGGGGYVKAVNVPLQALSAISGVVTANTYSVVPNDVNNSGLWQGIQYYDFDTGDPIYGTLIQGGGGTPASGITAGLGGFARAQINGTVYATINFNGGSGGTGRATGTSAGAGGGGASGPDGAGGAGGSTTSTKSLPTNLKLGNAGSFCCNFCKFISFP